VESLSYKTQSANQDTIEKAWWIVDAENQILGRFASQIAKIVRGKHKASYTPHADCGDHVIVINAEKISLSSDKLDKKIYDRYTGFPGGRRTATAREVRAKKPEALIEAAVRGMLPKNKLASRQFFNMHVFVGSEHNHQAQQPKELKFDI
jgi:large subunit ribosomal protein L13